MIKNYLKDGTARFEKNAEGAMKAFEEFKKIVKSKRTPEEESEIRKKAITLYSWLSGMHNVYSKPEKYNKVLTVTIPFVADKSEMKDERSFFEEIKRDWKRDYNVNLKSWKEKRKSKDEIKYDVVVDGYYGDLTEFLEYEADMSEASVKKLLKNSGGRQGDSVKGSVYVINKELDGEEDISYLSKEEEQAIDDYKKAIANTKDPSLLRLFSHILKEEIEHLEELGAASEGEFEDSAKDKVSKTTENLWYKVNERYGNHVYNLGTNGLGEVVLSKGYGKDIARGEKAVQEELKRLLKDFKDSARNVCEDKALKNLLSKKIETPRGDFYLYNGDWKQFIKEPDIDDWGFWFDHYDDDDNHFKIMHNHVDNSAIAVLKKGY